MILQNGFYFSKITKLEMANSVVKLFSPRFNIQNIVSLYEGEMDAEIKMFNSQNPQINKSDVTSEEFYDYARSFENERLTRAIKDRIKAKCDVYSVIHLETYLPEQIGLATFFLIKGDPILFVEKTSWRNIFSQLEAIKPFDFLDVGNQYADGQSYPLYSRYDIKGQEPSVLSMYTNEKEFRFELFDSGALLLLSLINKDKGNRDIIGTYKYISAFNFGSDIEPQN